MHAVPIYVYLVMIFKHVLLQTFALNITVTFFLILDKNKYREYFNNCYGCGPYGIGLGTT